jgi:cytochrome P450
VTMKSSPEPPGPKSIFPWRIPFALQRDPFKFFTNASRDYGDIVYFRLGRSKVYLLNHPDYVRDVLVVNANKFRKGLAMRRAKRLLGEGLLTSEGEKHRRQRRLMQPAFHHKSIMAHGATMVDCAERHALTWSDGLKVEMLEEMRRLSIGVVSRALFGADITENAGELSDAFSRAVKLVKLFQVPSMPSTLLRSVLPRRQRFPKARAILNAAIHQMINERRRDGANRSDVLSMLIFAVDEETGDSGMTNTQLRDEIMTLIQAGHETTSTALAWTWYLLAQNPDAERKLHLELDNTLQGRLPTADDIPHLPYTGYVFTESMRLFPPAWVLGRTATTDHEMNGYVIPAGSRVLFSQFVIHRDKRFYDSPERFIPERWSPEQQRNNPPLAYFPFGHGPHKCIGDGFAMVEGVLLMATLARRWRAKLRTKRAIKMLPMITLRPDHMPMVLEARDKPVN